MSKKIWGGPSTPPYDIDLDPNIPDYVQRRMDILNCYFDIDITPERYDLCFESACEMGQHRKVLQNEMDKCIQDVVNNAQNFSGDLDR